jgi:hypothetical protein
LSGKIIRGLPVLKLALNALSSLPAEIGALTGLVPLYLFDGKYRIDFPPDLLKRIRYSTINSIEEVSDDIESRREGAYNHPAAI